MILIDLVRRRPIQVIQLLETEGPQRWLTAGAHRPWAGGASPPLGTCSQVELMLSLSVHKSVRVFGELFTEHLLYSSARAVTRIFPRGNLTQLGLGERCKLPLQRGLGRSPSRDRIWCILALKYDIWWQQINSFCTNQLTKFSTGIVVFLDLSSEKKIPTFRGGLHPLTPPPLKYGPG